MVLDQITTTTTQVACSGYIHEDGYRFAYNGMEQDNEVSGNRNSYTTQFRQYDPRLGRWKSLDPLMTMFPHMSPYVGFDNNPILYIDPYGLSPSVNDEPENVRVQGKENMPRRRWIDKNGKRNKWEIGDIYVDKKGNEHRFIGEEGGKRFEDQWEVTKGEVLELAEVKISVNPETGESNMATILDKSGLVLGFVNLAVGIIEFTYSSSPYYQTKTQGIQSIFDKDMYKINNKPGIIKQRILGHSEIGEAFGKYNKEIDLVADWGDISKYDSRLADAASTKAKVGKVVAKGGRVLGWIGVGITVLSTGSKVINGTATASDIGWATADIVVGTFGMYTGPVGWIVSGVYFISKEVATKPEVRKEFGENMQESFSNGGMLFGM